MNFLAEFQVLDHDHDLSVSLISYLKNMGNNPYFLTTLIIFNSENNKKNKNIYWNLLHKKTTAWKSLISVSLNNKNRLLRYYNRKKISCEYSNCICIRTQENTSFAYDYQVLKCLT